MLRRLSPTQLALDVVLAFVAVLFRCIFGFDSAVMVAVVLGMGAALAIRRLSPAIGLGIAWLFAILQMGASLSPDLSNLAILAVLYCTARYGTPVVRWAGLISAIVSAVVATAYLVLIPYAQRWIVNGIPIDAANLGPAAFSLGFVLIASTAVLGLSWTLGLLVKTWSAARQSRRAQELAERATIVEQERNRIARDMHDVVAHSLAVVIAQADGARYARAQDPAAVDQALTTISATAREALADVRLLLAQLRHDQEAGPQPALADLQRLVDQLRASGLLVDADIAASSGELPAGHQLALYRIAQEALTNALRHGDAGRPVTFRLERSADAVTLHIANHLPSPAPAPGAPGHGLAGMRERALLVGGTVTAAPAGKLFLVDARIPVSA